MIYAETPRLTLRALKTGDLARLVELLGDPRIAAWLPGLPKPYGMNDARAFQRRMDTVAASDQPEYYLIERKADHAQIGAVGLHPPRDVAQEAGERVIGYWLDPDFWHRGYAAEAVTRVVNLAFDDRSTALLTATTQRTNTPSEHVLRKAGFHPSRTGMRHGNDGMAIPVQHWRLSRPEHDQWKESA